MYGSFFIVDAKYEQNGYKLAEKSNSRYFWVEALEFDKSSTERVDFRASVQGQSVHLNLLSTTKNIKSFRIYLHSSMINLKKKIRFYLNGELVLKRKRNDETPSPMDPKDPGFIFNDYVDIKLQ